MLAQLLSRLENRQAAFPMRSLDKVFGPPIAVLEGFIALVEFFLAGSLTG